jgi:hypothetical protein
VGLYGSYVLPNGLFFGGNVAYGNAMNEHTSRNASIGLGFEF